MASSANRFILSTTLMSLFVLPSAAQQPICPFEAIYQFGDSIAKTGYLIRNGPVGARSYAASLPYGETYVHRPTGRCSNGLLLIVYFAMALQLLLLNPYLDRNGSFDHGVNFAGAGSTALDNTFFAARNIGTPSTDTPLSIQFNWLTTHLNSVCRTNSDCARSELRRLLVMAGGIGGNDYNYGFFQGKSIQEIQTYILYVVDAIVNAVREVIRLGAVRVVVPGNFPVGCFPIYLTSFPVGCFPIYLTSFPNRDPRGYNNKGCLTGLNEFALSHNYYLQRALTLLRMEFPNAVILYTDYHTAFQSLLHRSRIRRGLSLRACCGTGGLYNFDGNRMCGSPGVPVCPNPDRHISWDGIHLTQNAYRQCRSS